MARAVKVRNLQIGQGVPKICVPVMGKTKGEILEAARRAVAAGPDLVEWRADDLGAACGQRPLLDAILGELRHVLGSLPLLFTFRTVPEGGLCDLPKGAYAKVCALAARSGMADLLDVELSCGDALASDVARIAHGQGVRVILSNHDFAATPPCEEIQRRLAQMERCGADIAKIAVTPRTHADLFALLRATSAASGADMGSAPLVGIPVISMAMGEMGVASRLMGEVFGSAVTFGTAGAASAPGQVPVGKLRDALCAIHACLPEKPPKAMLSDRETQGRATV